MPGLPGKKAVGCAEGRYLLGEGATGGCNGVAGAWVTAAYRRAYAHYEAKNSTAWSDS